MRVHRGIRVYRKRIGVGMLLMAGGLAPAAWAQNAAPAGVAALVQPEAPGLAVTQAAPPTVTLQDALRRAQQNEPQLAGALNAAQIAHEDTVQAHAALLPQAGINSSYFNTQGNGVFPSGRFVTNDGVHVYQEWATVRQDLSPGTLTRSGYHRAQAAEAVMQARAEIARRGVTVAVTRAYYGLVVAQRKYATAQLAETQAQQFVRISQELERGGEAPHSDVVKAQLQESAQQQVLREAKLGMDTARLDLTVLISANFDENYPVVDDLHLTSALPTFPEIQTMARRQNPDLAAAEAALHGADLDVTLARQAYLPTLTVDLDWGLQANQIGWNTVVAADPLKGAVPSVGYFLTASLNLPVWDWGARRSRLKQAQLRRQQATVDLSYTQRVLLRNVAGYYEEAQTAREQMDLLRQAVDLATESLRLNTLRYQAGEATILDLVDAQNALTQARNLQDDGQARYRVALATLQTVTGAF